MFSSVVEAVVWDVGKVFLSLDAITLLVELCLHPYVLNKNLTTF